MSERTRIDSIVIEGRHRKEFGDIKALAASIREVGLLQPVVITPELRLLAGERRIRAARSLGWDTIPARIVSDRDDAAYRLKAERDENTCRQPMTPEELVSLGLELERLEAPKAAERKAHGQTAPGRPLNAGAHLGPSVAGHPSQGRTSVIVADALGTSTNTYKRARHVVQTARGDNNPDPAVQEVAKEALIEMNAGTKSVSGAYDKVRQARENAEKPKKLTRPQPPKLGGNRKKHAAVIESVCISLSGLAMAVDDITEFDNTVTTEEATRLADDLSSSIRSLNRLKQNLYRKATS